MDDYSKNQIKSALNSVKSFDAWAKEHKIEPILIEEPLVSNLLNFGGTADIYGKVDGTLELIDLKTGKAIYDEHLIQVGGGYDILLTENDYPTNRVRILNIPRANSEKFMEHEIVNLKECKSIFINCLNNYQLHKTIRKEL